MMQDEHRRGSAAVALRRLSHPARDGRAAGLVVTDDQISGVTRRLSELLAVVEHRAVQPNANATPERTESVAPAAAVRGILDDDTGTAMITLRFDTQMLARIDVAAKRLGMSRSAWVQLAAGEALEGRR
jgi:hypothetical protein